MQETRPELRIGPNDILRFFLELFAIVTLGIWGFVMWPFPWNIVIGIAAPVVAILLWAFFRSPRAVFHVDVYGKSFVELLVMGAAVFAWVHMGFWYIGLAFGVLAVVSGLINGRKEFPKRAQSAP